MVDIFHKYLATRRPVAKILIKHNNTVNVEKSWTFPKKSWTFPQKKLDINPIKIGHYKNM